MCFIFNISTVLWLSSTGREMWGRDLQMAYWDNSKLYQGSQDRSTLGRMRRWAPGRWNHLSGWGAGELLWRLVRLFLCPLAVDNSCLWGGRFTFPELQAGLVRALAMNPPTGQTLGTRQRRKDAEMPSTSITPWQDVSLCTSHFQGFYSILSSCTHWHVNPVY